MGTQFSSLQGLVERGNTREDLRAPCQATPRLVLGHSAAAGEPLPALCRLSLPIAPFPASPTPLLCLPVPPPFVAVRKAFGKSRHGTGQDAAGGNYCLV